MKNIKRSFVVVLFCLLSVTVQAGPGIQVTAVSVLPQDPPKVAMALEEWMEGAGKGSKGRILLQLHVADGGDPATHSIVLMFPSVAENEAFSNKVQGSEDAMAEWMAFLGKIIPIA